MRAAPRRSRTKCTPTRGERSRERCGGPRGGNAPVREVRGEVGHGPVSHGRCRGAGRRGHCVARDRGRGGREFAVLGRQGLGTQRQRRRRGHGIERHPGLQPLGRLLGGRQRLQHRLHARCERTPRRGARRRRREDAQGIHPDFRGRGSDGPRVPEAALCRRLGARLLGDALPPAHGGSRHDRGTPREDRGEGARELGPQSLSHASASRSRSSR